jgi:predicted glycoside hydrolase/deacetylase ChbG (UPF0249 family)
MKVLIVNADDFGLSRGINRGILQAHSEGILTSASLLVDTAASDDAARIGHALPGLSIGLHADFKIEWKTFSGSWLRAGLERQLAQFEELMGCLPTHLDSHHNVHADPRALPVFLEVARQYGLPLRNHSSIRYFPSFYGRWAGESHFEQISAENLVRMLKTQFSDGITELSCHPGYVDAELNSDYAREREAELVALCSPAVRQALEEESIHLMSYADFQKIPVSAPC